MGLVEADRSSSGAEMERGAHDGRARQRQEKPTPGSGVRLSQTSVDLGLSQRQCRTTTRRPNMSGCLMLQGCQGGRHQQGDEFLHRA